MVDAKRARLPRGHEGLCARAARLRARRPRAARLRALLLALALGGAAACSTCEGEDEGGAGSAPEPAPPDPAAPMPAPEPRGLDPELARAALDAWVAAQNAGDFEAYASLYAERFEGIKRAGERAYRFDREGWLEDRRRMFQLHPSVQADDVRIATSPASAVVTFRQTWTSRTFRDEGPKQLVLVPSAEGRLLVAREEMLASRVVGEGALGAPAPEAMTLVLVAGGVPHVLVQPGAGEGLSAGPLRLLQRDDPATVARRAVVGALSEASQAWSRRAVRLYGAEGPVCTGTVGELRELRRAVPHFGQRQHWDGALGDPPSSEASIADDVWELGVDGALIAGVVIPDGPSCDGALWAREATLPPPVILRPEDVTGGARAGLLARFRALPAHGVIAREYRTYAEGEGAGAGPWDSLDGATPTLRRWVDPSTPRAFAVVGSRVGRGCGDFNGALWAVWEEPARGPPALRTDGAAPAFWSPLAMVDADGDGLLEIVVQDGLLRAAGAGFSQVLDVAPPYFDCDC